MYVCMYVCARAQFRSLACFTLRHCLHSFNFLQCVLQQTPYCVRSAWRLDLAYMESAAAWAGPYELQLAMNGTTEEAPVNDAQVWAPAVGHPLQYASIADIFGSSWSLQPYAVPASSSSSGWQQQLLEYNYYNFKMGVGQP